MEQKKREVFDGLIEKRWGTTTSIPEKDVDKDVDKDSEPWEAYSDDFEKPRHIPEYEDIVDHNGRLLNQQPAYNKLINLEVQMQVKDSV